MAYLGDGDEGDERRRDDEVDPEEPAQEDEVRGDGRAELRLDLLDAPLPRHQQRLEVDELPLEVLPFLPISGLKAGLIKSAIFKDN